jgi:hypothetical protein
MQALSFIDLVVWANGGLILVLSYFLRGVMDEHKQTKLDLVSMKETLHERYVKKDDFKEFKEELWHKLDDLKQQLKDK